MEIELLSVWGRNVGSGGRNVVGIELFHVKHYFYLYIVINTTISTNARAVGVRRQQAGHALAERGL